MPLDVAGSRPAESVNPVGTEPLNAAKQEREHVGGACRDMHLSA